ncbi:MAG: hypothetical protein DCF32_21985 [Leptolyngbya sp.]|nr:MAG: hypothetical protein DCF32_21985 [Leptolyngbya sp.]
MRTAIIEGQKGLEDFLNFVRDEGAVGSNPAIPILLKLSSNGLAVVANTLVSLYVPELFDIVPELVSLFRN